MASNKGLTKKTIVCLVGGIPTPLKSMKVNWDDDIPNVWKNNPNVPNHHFVPLCVSHCLGLGRQCIDCGDTMAKAAARPD